MERMQRGFYAGLLKPSNSRSCCQCRGNPLKALTTKDTKVHEGNQLIIKRFLCVTSCPSWLKVLIKPYDGNFTAKHRGRRWRAGRIRGCISRGRSRHESHVD